MATTLMYAGEAGGQRVDVQPVTIYVRNFSTAPGDPQARNELYGVLQNGLMLGTKVPAHPDQGWQARVRDPKIREHMRAPEGIEPSGRGLSFFNQGWITRDGKVLADEMMPKTLSLFPIGDPQVLPFPLRNGQPTV